jgi:beta-lactamase class D
MTFGNQSMHSFSIILLLFGCATPGVETNSTTRGLSEFFGGREGCFVLYDSQNTNYVRYNPKGCTQRFSPCSTFKVPHTVIALDTGVASGPEFSLRWDGVKSGNPAWDQNQTLRSAFQNSVVWFYQELARRIGPQREAQFVRQMEYGNMDTSGGATNFWLQSSLLISAEEQVTFLRKLWEDRLPVSRDAQRATREIMELSRRDGRIFYGKTGTGGDRNADIARLGWFVGCVRRGERTVFFATRITGERGASGREARRITEAILERLGI